AACGARAVDPRGGPDGGAEGGVASTDAGTGGDRCFQLPDVVAACPPSAVDPTGMGLPQSGEICNLPTCAPCGSATAAAYRDSSGAPRAGYCVCSASDGTGTYSCAGAQEWPPQSATGPQGEPCQLARSHASCTSEPACFNTCGPLKSGYRNC